jgi:hypothetical protein
MNTPLNSRWRVVSTRASLEVASSRSYGGGAIATSFSQHPVPPGTVIVYRGTRSIGSDAVPEDVFRIEQSEIAGRFRPSVWGTVDPRAIAPVVDGWIETPRKSRPIDAGIILDQLGAATIAEFDCYVMQSFINGSCLGMIYRASPTKLRRSADVQLSLEPVSYGQYRTWRATVERIRRNAAHAIAAALERLGGSATLRHGYLGTAQRSFGPEEIADAVSYGFARVNGDAITLTQRGCETIADAATPA